MQFEKQLLWRPVGNELVVLVPKKGIYFQINSSGKEIWNALQKGFSTPEIAEILSKKYDISLKKAQNDVQRFCIQLKKEGIIREVKKKKRLNKGRA